MSELTKENIFGTTVLLILLVLRKQMYRIKTNQTIWRRRQELYTQPDYGDELGTIDRDWQQVTTHENRYRIGSNVLQIILEQRAHGCRQWNKLCINKLPME
jgi:hypothetical protein